MTRWRSWVYPTWHPYPVFAALGLLSAWFFAVTGTVWAVTGEFTRLGGHLLEVVGVDPSGWAYYRMIHLDGSPFDRTDGWIVIAMLLGALAAALFAGDVKLRIPPLRRRMAQGLVGGIIAGFGARLALGCNLAALFTGVPQFSFHAWIFTATTALGTWLGLHVIRQKWWRGPTRLEPLRATAGDALLAGDAARRRRSRQRQVGWAVTALIVAVVIGYALTGHALLAWAAGFGAAFGVLIQRGQICFTAAFRDLWLSGRTLLGKALVIGLIAATLATFLVIQFGGATAVIKPAGLGTLVGGTLFGIGIVLAGGCETGMVYRAVEGQVHYWFVFGGNIIGATALAYGWDHLGIYSALVEGAPSINLVTAWGPTTALLATLLALIAWYAAMVHRERTFRYRGGGLTVGHSPAASPVPSLVATAPGVATTSGVATTTSATPTSPRSPQADDRSAR